MCTEILTDFSQVSVLPPVLGTQSELLEWLHCRAGPPPSPGRRKPHCLYPAATLPILWAREHHQQPPTSCSYSWQKPDRNGLWTGGDKLLHCGLGKFRGFRHGLILAVKRCHLVSSHGVPVSCLPFLSTAFLCVVSVSGSLSPRCKIIHTSILHQEAQEKAAATPPEKL